MSNDKIIDINKEAAQYLESSRKKLRRLSADWDDYAAEVPQKLIQLIKSGIKPKIERGNSGGRQLSVNLSFETNTDAAKEYIQTIQPTATKKAQVFADEFSDINKKLEYYYEQGIDSKVFSSLVKLLKSYADFMKSAQIDIRGNIISMNIPKEVDTVVSKWTKINDKQARENEAKRLGVNVEDLDNHKKYLDAKHKKDTARTSAVMNQAYKLFASIEGYLDSSSLAMECKNKAEELKSQEEEAERKRLEEERLRKEEEERQRKEKIYNEVVGLMNQATTSKQCEEVIKQFQDIKGFKDVDTLIEECINKKNAFEEQEEKARIEAERKKEEERKNGLYEEALFAMNQGTKSSYKDAVVLFKEIEDYKDSKEKIDECEKKIKDIEEREEKARIEAEERRKEEERKAKEEKEKRLKKKKKYMSLISIISIIVIVISIAVPYYKNVIAPSMKYNKAMDLLEDKEFDEAYTLFEELGSYKDCEDMLNETRYQQAMYCFENKDYETAMTLFDELGYYESSSRMYSQSCHYLGQQYLETGEYEKAEDVLSHVRYATDSKDLYNEAAYQLGIQ